MCMRWSYLQRTIPNIRHYFEPLEDAIKDKLIPSIVGRKVTPLERRIIALPVRHGGLGIPNPVETADFEFQSSTNVTKSLVKLITKQKMSIENYDSNKVKSEILRMRAKKETLFNDEFKDIIECAGEELGRNLKLATEKGAGAWLTALPIQSYGYALNKQEFKDGSSSIRVSADPL